MKALFTALLMLEALALPAMAAPVLEKVVILQRHGVRSPTKAPAALAPFAQDAWAAWPVAPGELTDHGALALSRMGEALRRHYAQVLSQGNCAQLFVWADNADQRTRKSGQVMAQALGCPTAVRWAMGDNDPLFHGDDICPADPKAAQAAVAVRQSDMLAANRTRYDTARSTLARILTPGLSQADCENSNDKKCALLSDRNQTKDGGKLSGVLADASTLSENLFLEYAQGMEKPGWGRMNGADLAAIMPLHDMASDLGRRTPLLAAHNATLLAHQIEALLTDTDFRIAAPHDARMVLLAGHDTNLSNIAGMLGLTWSLPGEPDTTAPDTALAFERWHEDKRGDFIRIRLFYQTVDQLRSASRLPTLPHLDLSLADCGESCALPKVTARLRVAMAQECLVPTASH
ncbi:MAG TPA: histidine-type phosphatase [Rhizomicrobium sp.]